MSADDLAAAANGVTPVDLARAAGANDLFVFRRIADRRFAHVGGVGRGVGWAGIVEIGIEEEPFLEAALAGDSVVRRSDGEPRHVLGPYYTRSVAIVPVSPDVFVLFGAEGDGLAAVTDDELERLGRVASETILEVGPAKRLADELEALTAVRELLHSPAETFDDALQRFVDHATAALSCEVGLLYLSEGQRLALYDKRPDSRLRKASLVEPLAAVAARARFPVCVQRAAADDLPSPFSTADGVHSYYLLEIRRPLPGLLLLLHTTSGAARGFTLLCQSLGSRLVEAAEPLLAAALLRDALNEELQRANADARRDTLTGLANRLAWNEALAVQAGSREEPATVIQLDCRGLKRINDTYGHGVGDDVLRRVAGTLTEAVRDHDLVARLGGDEFAILLRGADEALADVVVRRIESGFDAGLGDGAPEIRLAIGASTTRDGDLEAAQERADTQMLAAKRSLR